VATERNRSSSRRARVRLRAWALAALLFAPAAHADGTLLIVGGALAEDNAAVHRALIESLPPEGLLVIIPAASGRPARAADDFTQSLVRHGLARERIARFPLAVRDDSATPDVDESTWRDNAWATGHVERVRNAAGFWFTGGDQMRITQTLRNAEGEESPLLALIRARLAAGAVVGGSSAGAAIMSRDMIAGGISFRALLEPLASAYSDTEDQDSGRLYLARGLGFLSSGLVDQHFDRKARLGRLVRAMAATGQAHGFGIDEDTALEVRLGENSARVLGRGSVTLLDATHARYGFGSPALVADLEISVIAPGDRFRLSDLELLNTAGDATVGKEYFGYQPLQGGGMALANPRLDQGLGHDLLDNDASRVLKRYSIDEAGRVLVYRFTQTDRSAGYWRNEGARDHYTVTRVRFDILSLRATLPPH
jgi:cyanophycinase